MRILICLLFSILAADFATAGCNINLQVENETKYAIALNEDRGGISDFSRAFQVKTRGVLGGTWRSVDKGGWNTYNWADAQKSISWYQARSGAVHKETTTTSVLEPGKTAVGRYETVLGCGVKRRYRIDFTCHEIGEAKNRSVFIDKNVAHKTHYFPGPKAWAEGRNVTIPIKSCK